MNAGTVQIERERNLALRRADWRFLLPEPNPSSAVCFAPGLLRQAVGLVTDVAYEPDEAPVGGCDLAVVVNPTDGDLVAAWRCLRSGGALYAEWYGPRPAGVARAHRRVSRAGFLQPQCYWPWPSPDQGAARFWLPIEHLPAVRYFLATRPPAIAMRERVLTPIRRAAWIGARALGLTSPTCVVAIKGSRAAGVAPRASRVLLTGGPRSVSKAVALEFEPGATAPGIALKWPRVPESAAALGNEARTLAALQRPALEGVPRLIHFDDRTGELGQTVLRGQPVWTLLTPRNFRDIAAQATRWLVRLAQGSSPREPEAWRVRLIEPVVERFRAEFGPIISERDFDRSCQILAGLGPVPLVTEHRDFSPWNVLCDEDRNLVVLDWESAELHGLPLTDLLYFLAYLGFFLRGGTHFEPPHMRGVYRAVMDPASATGAAVAECLNTYARSLGLGQADVAALRLFTWMIHAHSEYQHFSADVGATPPPDVLRRSLFVALWEEELRSHADVPGEPLCTS
ncbi:MAG: phosphotransferase [Chloroflexota bacterium]